VSLNVIVVGAGIIGCAIARELAMRGAAVRIFEARVVGSGATHASAGVLAPYIEGHDRGPLFDLTLRSLEMYDSFIADVAHDSGLPIEYQRCGTIEVALDAEDAARMRGAAQVDGGTHLEWLDPQRVHDHEPAIPTTTMGGLLAPIHGYVRVGSLMDALTWSALRHGVQLEAGHRVARIAGKRKLSVTTEDGTEWRADYVVNAGGSWAGQIAGDDEIGRAVKPIRGQLLRLGWTAPPLRHIVWGPDCYIVPWEEQTVLVGATAEDVGFDERATAAGVRDLLDAACELLPSAWGATFVEALAGLRPASSDGLPIIGASPANDRVIYATGHFRNGILLAPLTAKLVADLIVDARHDSALDICAPNRFAHR
jgi:glycine oxidase